MKTCASKASADGWRIFHREVTASTNRDALDGKPGDVFTAGMQTAGRGRLDHRWISPPDENLMMSAVIDVTGVPPQETAAVPLVAGLSAARAAAALIAERNPAAAAEVRIKWPNDVLAGGGKLCGILCERNADSVVIGIGMNVNQTEFDPEIAHRATSLRLLSGCPFPVTHVRDAVLDRLSDAVAGWRKNGFASLLPAIAAFDCLKGETVEVMRTDDDAVPLRGICGGILADGTLDVAGEAVSAGEAHILSRGPVSG